MEDRELLALYWDRNEDAIGRTRERYGQRLLALAFGILKNEQDAEESESDTYLRAWNAIPPARPQFFYAWLAKVCRNLCLNRLERASAKKRASELVALTEELAQCVPDAAAERAYEERLLGDLLNGFFRTLKTEDRVLFLRRYFSAEPVAETAKALGMSESRVKSSLFRTRKKLRAFMEKEGIAL